MNKILLVLATLMIGPCSFAQEDISVVDLPPVNAPAAQEQVQTGPELVFPDKNKKIQLNFTDELVQGNHVSADSMFMDSKKGAVMKKLIRLRENFNSNMEKSKNEFKSR